MKNLIKKLIHPPEYPTELPSKGGKFSYWFHWHLRLTDLGRGQLVGRVTQLIPEFGIAILLLDKWGISVSFVQAAIFFVMMMCGVWFLGWLYVYFKQDIVTQILARYRDVMFKDLVDKINKSGKR